MSDMLNSAAASYILAGGLTPDMTGEWQKLVDQLRADNRKVVELANERTAKRAGESAVVAAMLNEVQAVLKKYPHLSREFQYAHPDHKPLRNELRREAEAATLQATAAGQTIDDALVLSVVDRVMQRESKK